MESYKIAGIDVHKKMLAVVVTDAGKEGAFQFERRKFGALDSDLRALAKWLSERGVREAVLESTAQYWKPVWRQLEPQCKLYLPKRNPIERHGGASGISPMQSGWYGGKWREN